ncbi:2-phytyl-1,4-beta-naphthoquinone methyltransferase, chloroplastic-like isoform X1 [Zingiber officinale]|uniref:2-phytyl-1,4-beta-naphthoquinone methyltransferase, chloroplastic-like isoform X1 n=1 Tax=Zingiber officinale TaxID=94328 RepID=UPI001C4D164C|nr:2-phytyl-1,4-beta-naphthoquinone methyltransferase, chloroplastic-like isoform X1 [Zingiber officinale]
MLSHFVGMAVVRRPPASLSSSAALHRRPPLPRPVFSYPRSLFSFSSPLGKTRICCSAQRQALFNRIAPIYDDLNDLLSLGLHRSWKRMCISWSGAKKGDRALDLCCGSGDLTFLLSQKVGLQGEVCGLDFSREQLSIASVRQDLYWKASYQNIQWIEGDALNLPFPDCYFDAITMGYGLRNLVDRQKALREIFRVLKPGSKVSILDFNKSTSNLVNTAQVLCSPILTKPKPCLIFLSFISFLFLLYWETTKDLCFHGLGMDARQGSRSRCKQLRAFARVRVLERINC